MENMEKKSLAHKVLRRKPKIRICTWKTYALFHKYS
jgi:hypothetical protein